MSRSLQGCKCNVACAQMHYHTVKASAMKIQQPIVFLATPAAIISKQI